MERTEETKKAYLTSTDKIYYRAGIPAEIIGVVFASPFKSDPLRAYYHILFDDGKKHYVLISDDYKYEIISEDDVRAGNIPEVKS